MARFWVVGGIYADTRFEHLVSGTEERIGPYSSHDDAKAEWQRRAWGTVDDAHARYRIEEEDEARQVAKFWVVGGIYTDTRFVEPIGEAEQWYGPFDSYAEAKAEWGRRAWSTVDDAHARFRIEKRVGDPRGAG